MTVSPRLTSTTKNKTMLDVTVLATGSSGNCYTLATGEAVIMLDCGLPFNKLHRLMKFRLPTAILITHEHSDHSKAVKNYLKRGVDVYMTRGTATALELEKTHRLHYINPRKTKTIDGVKVKAFTVTHDAAEPVGFLLTDSEDKVLYITDTGKVDYHFAGLTKILIEANHSEDDLKKNFENGDISHKLYDRIKKNHLSIERTLDFLESTDLSEVKEIHLIHASAKNGNGAEFKGLVEAFTGKKVYVSKH